MTGWGVLAGDPPGKLRSPKTAGAVISDVLCMPDDCTLLLRVIWPVMICNAEHLFGVVSGIVLLQV